MDALCNCLPERCVVCLLSKGAVSVSAASLGAAVGALLCWRPTGRAARLQRACKECKEERVAPDPAPNGAGRG